MKKILSLLMLLVAIVTGASAQSATIKTVDGNTTTWDLTAITADMLSTLSTDNWESKNSGAYYQTKKSTSESPAFADGLTFIDTNSTGTKARLYKEGNGFYFGGNAAAMSIAVTPGQTLTITTTGGGGVKSDDATFTITGSGPYTSTVTVPAGKTSIKVARDKGSATYCTNVVLTTSSKTSANLTLTSPTSVLLSKNDNSTIQYTTDSDGAVSFSSSSESVATVSDAGIITAVGGGYATITVSQAETDDYDAGNAAVNVYVPYDAASGTEFTIGNATYGFSDSSNNYYFTNGFSMSNSGGKSYGYGSLEGSSKYSAGTTYTINIPEGVSIMSATVTGRSNYTSSDAAANWGTLFGTDYSSETLPYSNQDPAEKVINFESAQTGTLTFTPGGNQAQFIIVLSTEAQTVVPVTGVTIDEAAEVEAGKTVTPVYTVLPEDATNKSVTWSSDNESVATVENGVVTGVAAGTANITVTTVDGNFSDVCVVTVTAPVPVEKTLPYSEDFTTWGGTTWSQGDTSNPDVIKGITFYSKSGSKQFSASDDGLTFPNNNISSSNYFMAIQLTGVENSKIKITLTPASTSGKAAVKYILKNGETEVGTPGDGVIEASAANEGEDIVIFADCTNNDAILYLGRKSSDDQNKTFESIAIDFAKSNAITLNSKGFATYSSKYDFTFDGADAYGMTLSETSLVGTKVTSGQIKAGEGILFKGEAGATVAITETTGAEAIGDANNLIGTTNASEDIISSSPAYKYALSGDTFLPFTGTQLQANKAFFGSDTAIANSLDMVFEDEATAINGVNANENLNVNVPVKVIKNGQLVIETANGVFTAAGAQVK